MFTGFYGNSVSTGYCMDVVMMSTDDLLGFSVSVSYDNDVGLALVSMYEWVGVAVSFGKGILIPPPVQFCAPEGGLSDNGGILQSFDCTIPEPNNPPVLAAGTYQIGTIIWDMSGMIWDGWGVAAEIAAYIDDSVDAFLAVRNGNIVDISSEVRLGSHVVRIIPEPGTAALLGLGLVGLVLTARRRRPPQH